MGWRNGLGKGPDFEIRTAYDLFDVIERKPVLFIGEQTLSALQHFYLGYCCAMNSYGVEFHEAIPDFGGFHDYVALYYKWRESTAGWRNIILQECSMNEGQAYGRFFDLLRNYRGGQS